MDTDLPTLVSDAHVSPFAPFRSVLRAFALNPFR